MRSGRRSDVTAVERPARAYAVRAVERRWQRRWEERACHGFDPASGSPRSFANGELHMGHVRNYVLGDVVARYQRSNGKNVPIELVALERGHLPDAVAVAAVQTMTRQLRALGISYDWSRVPMTGDPDCAVVLSAGRKLSMQHGTAVSPETLLREFGADALRVGMLWAASSQGSLEWSERLLVKAAGMLDATHALVEGFAAFLSAPAPDGEISRAALALHDDGIYRLAEVTRFIEECRPNAALGVLDAWRKRIAEFLGTRLPAGRLRPHDRKLVAAVLDDFVLALAPFAPHLAEECWQRLGHSALACNARWPVAGHAVSS